MMDSDGKQLNTKQGKRIILNSAGKQLFLVGHHYFPWQGAVSVVSLMGGGYVYALFIDDLMGLCLDFQETQWQILRG